MEAYKNLIKNIVLFLFIGAVPSICWAAGLFAAFSWPSFFLLLGSIFCILWLKARGSSQILRKILLAREEEWAICEGDQIIEHSPYFPANTLSSFKTFLHPNALLKVETALAELIHDEIAFQMRIHTSESDAIYAFEGEPFEGKIILWLKNVTESIHKERLLLETLQKNESLIANLKINMDLLPILVWHRDQNQRIIYCNLAYARAVQASPEKVYEEDIELIQSRFARTLARKALNILEPQSLESAAIAEGERRYFRICETPISQGQGTIGVAYDMTELSAARAELKHLIEAHDEVLDHLSTAIAVFNAEGTLQYYNHAYVNLHHFEENFLKAHPRLDEVLEELRNMRQLPEYADFPTYKKRRLQQLKEQVIPQEELMHLPDERTLRIFSAPHPMGGLLFMYEDVTDYLTLERKNKTLLDAYQTTLDNLFEGVVVIGSDNRLKIFNPSFARLWNFAPEEIQPNHHLGYIVEKIKDFFEYEGEWEPYKAQIIENITDRIPKTGQLKRKDGTVLNFGYVPLPNGDHLLSYTDATDTCRVQQALQERNEALETADRLKSEFIANVSCELRSPLNTIIGFTEILSHQYFGELNERQIDYVNGVLESSSKLLHLVNDILDLASIEAGYLILQPRLVHIPSLLQEVIDFISKRAEINRQNLVLVSDKNVQEWVVDERRLKQALFNLLSNAIKFTPEEGKITLEAKLSQNRLEISVTDTGIGIALEEQSRIFEKFERGKGDVQSGAGLGLSLVKSLIELHGGHIQIHSELNKGTTIRCCLPQLSHHIQQPVQSKNSNLSV
jgi:signal transduction histidine kinase/transcriptional regulator with PAS, ATPase and Fis domain